MRPRSHFKVDRTNPRARAVCDRCGQHWQLSELLWQYEWTGPRLQNLRFFVCPPCHDKYQEQRRLIIIPADPVPVLNPRVEQYALDDNGTIYTSTGLTGQSSLKQKNAGLSGLYADPNFFQPTYGTRIGTLNLAGGLNSAFDGVIKKYSWQGAAEVAANINSSYQSYIGINWAGNQSIFALPSSLQSPVLTHSLSSVSFYAPIDRGFLDSHATTYQIQYSAVNSPLFGSWTTIVSGTTLGVPGESVGVTITSTMNNPLIQFHRVAFLGNGTSYVAVAQVTFSVNETSSNTQGI